MIYTATFTNSNDAKLVSQSLKESHTVSYNKIIFTNTPPNYQAFELVARLQGIGYYFDDRNFCNLSHKNDPEWELRECNDDDALSIYVRCLAAYNHGYLHGMWIDCCQDSEDILEDIEFMLSWSPVRHLEQCEEWAIHDYQNWGDISISEYEDLESISDRALKFSEHGEAYLAYLSYFGEDYEDFEDKYQGKYNSILDYAYEYVDSSGLLDGCSEFMKRYFDYDAFSRDLELGGEVTIVNKHVFSCI